MSREIDRRAFLAGAGAFAAKLAYDGLHSPRAEAAATEWISPTPETVDRLQRAVDVSGHPTIGNGSRDVSGTFAVQKAQYRLNAKQFNAPIGVDGAFGPITQGRVQEFQTIWHIPETGILDELTWSFLLMETPPVAPTAGHAIVLDQSLRHVWLLGAENGRTRVYVEGDVVDNPGELPPGEYRTIADSHLPITSSYASNKKDAGNLALEHFSGFAAGGDIGFHRIPYDKETGIPLHNETALGVPANITGQTSKGCVRTSAQTAAHIFGMPITTRVMVQP